MDADRASYLKSVEASFVGLRGRGFMLSPRDVALVDGWRQRGVPARVVIAAVEAAAERFRTRRPPGVPLPSALAYFANQVEAAAGLWMERTLSWEASGPPEDAEAVSAGAERAKALVMGRIAAAGKALEDGRARESLRVAWRSLRAAGSDVDIWTLTAEVDRSMVEDLTAALSDVERETLLERARQLALDAAVAQESEAAVLDRALLMRTRLIRERFGVPDLVDALLEGAEALEVVGDDGL